MVATSGSGWRLAPSLVAFINEADGLYPNRDRSSDGSIGDLAHSSRESDHNPYDGWVHAVDLDEDIAPGTDLRDLASHLLATRDPRVRYVIYEGRIFKSYVDSSGHASWTWMPYTGTNAHTQHLHLSINRTDQARSDLRAWFPPPPPPPTTEDDDVIRIVNLTDPGNLSAGVHTYAVAGVTGRHMKRDADIGELIKRFGAVDERPKGTTSSLMFHLVNGPLKT